MKNTYKLLALVIILTGYWANAQASKDVIKYKVSSDVIYGQGKVLNDSKVEMLDLWMDVYEPAETSNDPLPAVILTHGGSFHRGNPRETYLEAGAQTTSMSNYAKRLAGEGFVCFTIKYRLAGENPVPSYEGYSDNDLDPKTWTSPAGLQQVNLIRQRMDLQSLTPDNADNLKNAILAAAEDLRTAIRFVKKSSKEYKIDKNRIAVGGFSAGAVTSISVAYGLHEEVAAVFINSGFPGGFNIYNTLTSSSKNPAILLFMGQYDLPAVSITLPPFLKHLEETGVNYKFCWVPGFGHFYPGGAVGLSNDGLKISVEERIIQFLNSTLKNN